jgi:hypothetical protein
MIAIDVLGEYASYFGPGSYHNSNLSNGSKGSGNSNNSGSQTSGVSLEEMFDKYVTPKEGSISINFTWVIPIAPPAITVNPSVAITGNGRKCCDKKSGKYKLEIYADIVGEADFGIGTSVGGVKYQPKGRGSKWQDAKTGKWSKSPSGLGGGGSTNTATTNNSYYCEDSDWGGHVTVGVRGYASVGVGPLSAGPQFDANYQYTFVDRPKGSASAGIGSGNGSGIRLSVYFQAGVWVTRHYDWPN